MSVQTKLFSHTTKYVTKNLLLVYHACEYRAIDNLTTKYFETDKRTPKYPGH